MDSIVFYATKFVLFFGLYFSFLWVLILLNSSPKRKFNLKTYPNVSIIIPAYNEEIGIEKTINSCLSLDYKGKLQIIVVNDCSKDKTLELANKYSSQITVIDKKKNGGKAGAVNSGLEIAKYDYVGVIDADSEISTKSVENAIKYFFQKNKKDEIGAVICKMKPINESGNLLERIQLIEYMMVGLMRSMSASIRLLHLTPGVLSIYRKDILDKLGGFDNNNLTEDFEIGVRVRKMGYLIEYAHNSPVYTNTPTKFSIFLKQRIRWSRGFLQTHKKHSDIMFNKKYGMYGLYQFPMNILGPILYFVAVYLISFKIYQEIYKFVFKLINAPDTITWFSFESLSEFIKDLFLTIDPKVDFLISFSLMCIAILIYGIIKFYSYNFFKKDTLKKICALIFYIMIYNYVYIYVWIVSVIKEFQNKKYDWGTKN